MTTNRRVEEMCNNWVLNIKYFNKIRVAFKNLTSNISLKLCKIIFKHYVKYDIRRSIYVNAEMSIYNYTTLHYNHMDTGRTEDGLRGMTCI
jgi:hypothetical protein